MGKSHKICQQPKGAAADPQAATVRPPLHFLYSLSRSHSLAVGHFMCWLLKMQSLLRRLKVYGGSSFIRMSVCMYVCPSVALYVCLSGVFAKLCLRLIKQFEVREWP